ncbi:hypothetical protein GGH92_001520, partial [Coemansia sp. RSA 2673]
MLARRNPAFARLALSAKPTQVRNSSAIPANTAWKNANPSSEFTVSETTGFLPRHDPLPVLPSYFERLEELLHEMPISKGDGTYGLLHSGRFGERIER